jgi:WD40 repeat protein
VIDVAWSPEGSRIATASTDRTARTWDAQTGEPLDVLTGHLTEVNGVVFSPDGSRLVSVSGCCAARVWALDLDDLVRIARDQVTRDLVDEECRRFLHRDSCDRTATG